MQYQGNAESSDQHEARVSEVYYGPLFEVAQLGGQSIWGEALSSWGLECLDQCQGSTPNPLDFLLEMSWGWSLRDKT